MSKPFCMGKLPPEATFVRPYTVGITGSRGTGKSMAGDLLAERHGAGVIDTDHLTHELLEGPGPAYEAVLTRFGADLAPANGAPVNRDLLRERAFASREAKADLEAIMFPAINDLLETRIVELGGKGHKVVFVLVPLLHEAGLREYFDEVWCVVANEQVRLERLMARDHLTEDQARQLISLMMTQTEKAKQSDYLIDNSSTVEKTAAQVAVLFEAVTKRAEGQTTTQPAEPADETDEGKSEDQGTPIGDGPCNSEAANAHYRKILRQLAEIGIDEDLTRLGNVAGTQHQEASTRLSMVVDRESDGSEDRSRQLDVEVKMSVRNKPGAPDNPDGCSCGCGANCRISCTCKPDCGCKCQKPCPPTPPPPPKGDSCKSRLWLVVLALLGLFGLLAFLYAYHHNHNGGGGKIVIINELPCPEKCKPTDPVTPPPPVVEPPFTPPTPPPGCPSGKQVVDEAPGFAFRFLHNAVRVKVTKWEVNYGEGCNGVTVAGFDSDKRLLVYQVYDPNYWMEYQWVISYFPNNVVQIDRFEGKVNVFVGRTVYRYNLRGEVVRAEQFDGGQRRLYTATFVKNASGATVALNVEEFDPATGRPTIKRVVEGIDSAAEFLRTKFYVFGWYAQL